MNFLLKVARLFEVKASDKDVTRFIVSSHGGPGVIIKCYS